MTASPPATTPTRASRRAGSGLARALVVLVALAGATAATPAPAQEDGAPRDRITWGIRPSRATGPDGRDAFVYTLDPGTSVEDHVGVSNFTERPLQLAVYATDAFTSGDGHFDLLPAAQDPTDVGSWVSFADEVVTVPPRSRLDIPFRLTVPDDATPGDHPGGIVAALATTTQDASGTPFTVDRRVGARIYLRVDGDLAPAVGVTDVAVSYDGTPNPLGTGEATVTYTITNTGNVRIQGAPVVEVAGPLGLGRRRATGPEISELLPGSTLTSTVVVTSVAPLGRLAATVTLHADAVGAPEGTAAPVATGAAATWAVPWPHLALLVLLTGAVVGWRRRR